MDRDWLFIETLDDLHTRSSLSARSEYDILRGAGLLRQLLIDGDKTLLPQVNKTRGLPIRFRVNVQRPIWDIAGVPKPDLWVRGDDLDPDTALPNCVVGEVSLDDFLTQRLIGVNEIEITVKDVIRQAAHVNGAIHAGKALEDRELVMAGISQVIRIGGFDPIVKSLQAIGRVVVVALRPLRDQIEAEISPDAA
jgi:hypothetical protein